jgi:hypothetical protein
LFRTHFQHKLPQRRQFATEQKAKGRAQLNKEKEKTKKKAEIASMAQAKDRRRKARQQNIREAGIQVAASSHESDDEYQGINGKVNALLSYLYVEVVTTSRH